MKTFEEKFTAWVDGRLEGEELAAFTRELEAHPEALAEKESALELGRLLRTHLPAQPLSNGDFFNHSLLRQILEEEPKAAPAPTTARSGAGWFWSMQRLVFSGGFCLVLATLLFFFTVPKTQRQMQRNREYVANILSAHTDDPEVSATAFHSKEDNVTVLWLDGLKYIPRDQKLK